MNPITSSSLPLTIRLATLNDIPALTDLISTSVRTLHAPFYTQAEIEGSLASVYGTDTTIVQDGNYFVVTAPSQEQSNAAFPANSKDERIIGCGGWSFRSTLYGGDQFSSRDDDNLMNPETDAAKIRALFVHPDFTRRGIGRMMLERCEQEARKRGFKRAEIGATLAGVDFYRSMGYEVLLEQGVKGFEERELGNGEVLKLVRMGRKLEE
jgi:N-acetylglutamate synthase-like GNAT family acetyltransferase